MDPKLCVVECSNERHGEQVLDIFNRVILTSTALYDYLPRSAKQIEDWFLAKEAGGWPIIGIESQCGLLQAFGSFGPFRNFPAYKYTVEHSVYVAEPFRGQGLGRAMLELLIEAAKRGDFHTMIGAIDAENSASCELHEKLGFSRVGTLPQVGYKFGDWLDLALYQLTFATPTSPREG